MAIASELMLIFLSINSDAILALIIIRFEISFGLTIAFEFLSDR
ncbi:hypothetical protein [Kamptonema animale]|nr:hypothetical protein [Kamptonema animale]